MIAARGIPETPKRARARYSLEFALAYEIYTNAVLAEAGRVFPVASSSSTVVFLSRWPREPSLRFSSDARARSPIDKRPFHPAR